MRGALVMCPQSIGLNLMVVLLDTASWLLSTVTRGDMVAGVYDASTMPAMLQNKGEVPVFPTVVRMYPDGSEQYTVQIRFYVPFMHGEASVVLIAPVDNDSCESIDIDHTHERFFIVVDPMPDDGDVGDGLDTDAT